MNGEIKKSYNPFKMWGSWVGGFIGFFSVMFMGPHGIPLEEFVYIYTNSIAVIFPTIGFLIGWGIHSLIRKIRNKTGSKIVPPDEGNID